MIPLHPRSLGPWLACGLLALSATAATAATTAGPAPKSTAMPAAPNLNIEEHTLANGMRIVLIPQHLAPTVAGAWVAHVGSANERPGITGISHLFEHMMFKGTHVIGTRDYDRDAKLIDEQERVQDQMRAELSTMRAAQRRGELDDITKPEAKTPHYRQLETLFDSLVVRQRANMIKNEFELVLQRNGGTGMNAFTNEDMTVYFETVPANKLELWFWVEADRLRNRVFREFYSERDVVYEERRRSYESTPTGLQELSFDATFWDSSPYSWPVIGWPSDVAAITKAQADEYYALYYAPQNLTAFLAGDFDTKTAVALAEKYLGAIPAGPRPAPEMITAETRSTGQKRFLAEAETNPSVNVRWHTVAFQHRDVPALEVLTEVLNGPTGRLQKNLVLTGAMASSARAQSDNRKYEGAFEISADCKDGRSPEEVERAVLAQVERLRNEPVPDDELQRVKNRYLAAAYRQLGSPFQLLLRYAVADGRGNWRDADRIDREVQAVTAADLQRAANRYFTKDNSAVALWTRKGGPEDPALAALPAEARAMAKQFIGRLDGMTEAAQVQRLLDRLDQMGGQMPPEAKPAVDFVRARAQAKLGQLTGNK